MWKATAIIGLCLFFIRTQAIVSDQVFENCVFLGEGGDRFLKASWTVRTADRAIDFQICGCDSDEVDSPNMYMGFGVSGSSSMTHMLGADATIAWVDIDDGPQAVDYHLSGLTQCREGVGACPDMMDSSGDCTNDVLNITGFRREGLQCVSFSKAFTTDDTTCDIPFNVTDDQYIVWAVGSVGETAFKHFRRATADDDAIQFGRNSADQCHGGLLCPNCPSFKETVMDATGRNETFVSNIGPPGNPRGYTSIANRAGWGIAWYINDTLIPRIMVERGYTYTFKTMGGDDPETPGQYHPFYLTSSPGGGYFKNSALSRGNEIVYAGIDADDTALGVGPYCEYRETLTSTDILNTCGPEQDYFSSIDRCNVSPDNIDGFTWVPDETTPDLLYYQCATHLNLGYKIMVVGHAPKLMACSVTVLLMLIVSFLQ